MTLTHREVNGSFTNFKSAHPQTLIRLAGINFTGDDNNIKFVQLRILKDDLTEK
jgi:hypothetical protein